MPRQKSQRDDLVRRRMIVRDRWDQSPGWGGEWLFLFVVHSQPIETCIEFTERSAQSQSGQGTIAGPGKGRNVRPGRILEDYIVPSPCQRGSGSVKNRADQALVGRVMRSEEHTSELQSRLHLVCRLLLEKKKTDE